MDRIRIVGVNPLSGTIPISGAKNAALPLMIASLLTDDTLTLENVPHLADVEQLIRILGNHGADISVNGRRERQSEGYSRTIHFTSRNIVDTTAPYELVSKMRASFWVIGPLLAREGRARVSLPGGCAIGTRPVDLFIEALTALGARIDIDGGYIDAKAPEGGLIGARYTFPKLSGARHLVLPDRIETGTYAMAVAMTGGDVILEGTDASLLDTALEAVRRAGAEITTTNSGIRVVRNGAGIKPVDVVTDPFPGFPTDLQAQFMGLMTKSSGVSHITETIFENRFMHVQELARLGAKISLSGQTATIEGVQRLRGAPVMATDLRASVSLVIAGLAAEGETLVSRVYHLERGFERLDETLTRCGAHVERVSD